MLNPKEQHRKDKKNLLNSQSIKSLAANIQLIRQVSMPTKNETSIIRKNLFLVSMIIISL